jgi:hypothetical protein
LQQAWPDQPLGSVEVRVHAPFGSLQVTPPEQQLEPQVTVHDCVAVHVMEPEHDSLPQ